MVLKNGIKDYSTACKKNLNTDMACTFYVIIE